MVEDDGGSREDRKEVLALGRGRRNRPPEKDRSSGGRCLFVRNEADHGLVSCVQDWAPSSGLCSVLGPFPANILSGSEFLSALSWCPLKLLVGGVAVTAMSQDGLLMLT